MTFRHLLSLGLATLLAERAHAAENPSHPANPTRASAPAASASAHASAARAPALEQEHERFTWALGRERTDVATGRVTAWSAAGPFLFSKTAPDGAVTSGFRPFWVQTKEPISASPSSAPTGSAYSAPSAQSAHGTLRSAQALYPVFTYRADADTYAWSFLELIKRSGRKAGAPAPQSMLEDGDNFDIWPFWFSRTTRDPATTYRALFPIHGTIKSRLGFDRLSWTLFPFYVQAEKRGATATSTPWPFIRTTRGAARGFAFWPLFGWQERPGEYRDEFYLWPLGYNNTKYPRADDPPGTAPSRQIGALPFYARATAPGWINEDYLWPFFGYTDRTIPHRYHETRYFWPLFVQGRGDDRFVNRWGPFYTHSVIKGTDKTWIAWPLYRRAHWTTQGIAQTKTQFLYFLYWSLEQRSVAQPALAPASIRHIWPFVSTWDNGAGRRQVLALSPFEVFFPGNTKIRESWSPLFALYRFDQRTPGHARHTLLWDLIAWETKTPSSAPRVTSSSPTPRVTSLSPLAPGSSPVLAANSAAAAPHEEQRLTFARGLLGLRRPVGERAWRLFALDFPAKANNVSSTPVTATVATAARTPLSSAAPAATTANASAR